MKLKSGEVVIDRYNSHLKDGIAHILPDALARIESNGRTFFVEEVDFGQPIGETICVATGPSDEIVYAKRPKRFGYTRFVKNRQPEPCSSVVIILKTADGQADAEKYVLVTAFIGRKPEPEPWDTKNFAQQENPAEAERKAREFWSSHALIYDNDQIIQGTEKGGGDSMERKESAPPGWRDDYDDILQRARKLVGERRPDASPQKHAAFANSVAYLVTGWAGGYGGPSVREHASARLDQRGSGPDGRKTFEEACDLLLKDDGVIFGPITDLHRKCWVEEFHQDDDPEDRVAIEG